jgi:hypothetical protein
MARPSEDFAMAWSSLSGDHPELGWQTISIGPSGPLEVRAGRRAPDNAEAVLVGFASARLALAERLPDGQGFVLERADPDETARLWLALTRRANGTQELFTDMVCNVIGALDGAAASGLDEPGLLRVFVGRVRAWQEFMRKGVQPLSPESEIGLFGELEVLCALIDAGVMAATAVRAWVGPLDQPQDFEIGTGAIEAKTTLAETGFVARIGSLEQLDDSTRQPLFVVATRLRQVASGATLPQMVSAAREKTKDDPEAASLLDERLLCARYLDSHAPSYTRRFELVSADALEVGPEFPRLTNANVPAGVLAAVYDIDLDRTKVTGVELATALKKLGAA